MSDPCLFNTTTRVTDLRLHSHPRRHTPLCRHFSTSSPFSSTVQRHRSATGHILGVVAPFRGRVVHEVGGTDHVVRGPVATLVKVVAVLGVLEETVLGRAEEVVGVRGRSPGRRVGRRCNTKWELNAF